MRKKSYAEMRASGLCTVCGKQNPTPEMSRCPDCRDRGNANRRANKAYLKKIGICVRCGRNPAEPHKVLCYECAGKENDERRGLQRTEEQKEKDRERKGTLAAERTGKGLCPKCGKNPSIGNGLCGGCRAYLKRYRESNRRGLPRSERPSYGLCYICGKPVMQGKKVCESCYEARLKTMPYMWANMSNEYFRQLETARIEQVRARMKTGQEGIGK